jgi:hypothetical protein
MAEDWTNAMQAYSYDVIDEGPDQVVAGTRLAGCNTIVLMVSANEGQLPAATPHNPHRQSFWGEAYFRPTTARYPERLIPAVSGAPQSDADVALPALQKVAEAADILTVPWMQILRTPVGADQRNSTVNALGEVVSDWLCPNGPDTLDFTGALCVDCVERFRSPALFIDKIRFPSHGGGGPRSIVDAMTCFCDGCFDRAKAERVDLEKARHTLLGWLDTLKNDPTAAVGMLSDLASSAIRGVRAAIEAPEIVDLLRFRHRTVTRLVQRVRAAIPGHTVLWLDTWQPTEAWILGQDLHELAAYATWIKPFFYHQIVTWSVPGLIRSISSDTLQQQTLYESYLNLLGYEGPSDFPTFAKQGLSAASITSEMARAKALLGGRANLAAGVGIWACGPDIVREALTRAAAAKPNGVWMHCFSWATMDEIAAAGDWLRQHDRASLPRN